MNNLKGSTWMDNDKIHWFFALVASVLFIGLNGYSFNYGDQEEHLPQVYKLFNPSLYPNDYFMVPNELTFSVRFYYKWLVYGVSLLTGVETACFLLTMTALIVSAWSVSKISMYFDNSKLTAFIAPVLLLLFFNTMCIGDNSFQDNELIGSTLAVMFCALAFVYYFKEKYVWMAVCIGLGGLFQILAALIVAILLCSMLVIHNRKSIPSAAGYFSIFILVSLPMLGPILYRQFIMDQQFDKSAYYIALYKIRNPNHYLPSYFPKMEYLKFTLLAAASFLSMYLFKAKNGKFVLKLTAIVVIGMICYYLLLEKAGYMGVGKTQWFKATIWLTLCYSILISIALKKVICLLLDEKRLLRVACLSAIPLVVIVTFIIFQSVLIPHPFFKSKYRIGNYQKSDIQKMHEWIAVNTPVDAVFLVSPGNLSFLCDAKRSLLIAHKSVIHEPYFLIPWANNFQRIFEFKYDTLVNMSPLEAGKMGYNRRPYIPVKGEKLDYRLDNLTECTFTNQLGREIHREGDYILTEIRKEQAVDVHLNAPGTVE